MLDLWVVWSASFYGSLVVVGGLGLLCVVMLVVWWLLWGGGRSAGDGWCGCGVTVCVGTDWWTVGGRAVGVLCPVCC